MAVLHNNDLNQVTWEMRAMGGAPKFEESQRLPDIDYAAFATGIGLGAATVTEPGEMAEAWQRALAADRPFVLDVHCDPNVPPVPPHTTFEQAKSTAMALVKGDVDTWGVLKQGIKTKAQEVLPLPRTPS